MRLALALALLIALASPASATPEYVLPTLFDVTGVDADDVLNIRERPDGDAPIIGTLRPDATGIEVVGEHGAWMQVNTAERSGWVHGRYLNYRVDVWRAGKLPAGFSCLGTEPFWSLTPAGDQVILATPEGDSHMPLLKVLDSGWSREPRRGLVGEGFIAVVTPNQCGDGMSDRAYGMEATVILGGGKAAQMLRGCCRLTK